MLAKRCVDDTSRNVYCWDGSFAKTILHKILLRIVPYFFCSLTNIPVYIHIDLNRVGSRCLFWKVFCAGSFQWMAVLSTPDIAWHFVDAEIRQYLLVNLRFCEMVVSASCLSAPTEPLASKKVLVYLPEYRKLFISLFFFFFYLPCTFSLAPLILGS